MLNSNQSNPEISNVIKELNAIREPMRRDVLKSLASILDLSNLNASEFSRINQYYQRLKADS